MSKLVNKYRVHLVALLLVAVTFVAYWQVLGNDFILFLDDANYVAENSHVRNGLDLTQAKWALTSTFLSNWHPLTWISHMVDCQLHGLKPEGHHLTSLLLHLANTILLFLVLRRMTGFLWRSAFVAALFAINPLHVESVAWIAERKDVLSTFFWMLTIWAYVRYAECPKRSTYLPVVLLFALGLMSKPMLVTLPFALLLLDYWPLGRLALGDEKDGVRPSTFWRLICEKMPLFALAIGSSIITLVAQRKGEAVSSFELLSLGIRVSNALVSYVSYIGKMLWPRNLAVFYPHPGDTLPVWQVIGAAVLLACISVLVIRARRRPYLAVGWLWYVGSLIPVIGLVQVGGQAMADRYTYVPLIGLFIIIAWAVPELLGRPLSSYLPIPATLAIAAFAVCTWSQVGHWQNSITLFQDTLRHTTGNYTAHNCLGAALASAGEFEEAAAQHRAALSLAPSYASAHNNLGAALAGQGKTEEAIQEYRKAIDLMPDYASAHSNLGETLALQGDLSEAAEHYSKAVEIEPNNAVIHHNLGNTLALQGKFEEAIREYRKALSINPGLAQARKNLASALEDEKRTSKAVQECLKAVSLSPDSPSAHYNLGVALGNQGKLDQAIREYRQAVRIKPDYGRAHKNLAVALYFKQDYVQAWKEVHLARRFGSDPHPGFVKILSQKMPNPGR